MLHVGVQPLVDTGSRELVLPEVPAGVRALPPHRAHVVTHVHQPANRVQSGLDQPPRSERSDWPGFGPILVSIDNAYSRRMRHESRYLVGHQVFTPVSRADARVRTPHRRGQDGVEALD